MDTNKNRLNLFIELSAIQAFLQKHVPENLEFQKVFTDCAFTVDIIDAPQRLFYRADHETAELELDRRGSMYMAEEQESLQEAHLILNQEGAVQGNAPQELQNVMQIYLMFCLNMSVWLREHGVFDRYSDLNPESQGVLIEENGDRLVERPVSGRERPDLACKLFTGEVKMMRPYSEDMMRGVLLDALPLEKKEAAAEAGDTGMMQHLFEYYMGNNVSPHKDLMNNMKRMQKLMKAISGEGSDETEEDEEEEDTRNPEKAFYWLKKLAESGDVESAKLLSKFYSKGFGCERDFVQAVRCLDDIPEEEKAEEPIDFYNSSAELFEKAKAGDADAQCSYALNLAMLGKLVPSIGQDSDYAEAFQWAQKAAAQNNLEGMAMLVTYYQQGIGVPKDEKKAFRLCEKAAMRGHSDSQERLARMYFEGIGTEKDTDKAIEWAQKAANQGDLWAIKTLIRIYVDPEGGKRDLTEAKKWAKKAADLGDEESKKIYEQIAAAGLSLDDTEDSDAFKRVKAEAENGSVEAMKQLARYFAHRPGGREDLVIAREWAQKAAELGDEEIKSLLDELNANLRGEVTSFEDARTAAEAGNASAQQLLGTYYAVGHETEVSLSKALYWNRKAAAGGIAAAQEFVNYFEGVEELEQKAAQGDAHAQAELAGKYIAAGRNFDTRSEKLFAEALKMAEASAAIGNPHGMFMLGLCNENGYGMKANPEEAFRLYQQSAEAGDPDGQCELSNAYQYGVGTELNQSEAFHWAKRSADSGNGRALMALATFYELGVGGVTPDYEEAVHLMQKAVEKDVPDAERELALLTSPEGMLLVGKTILGLDPKFGESDKAQAARLIERAAEGGNGEAQFLSGMLNLNGVGVEQDYEKAVKWFRKGAESGNEDAAKNVAQYDKPKMFMHAALVELNRKDRAPDQEKVFRLLKEAAEGGFVPAMSTYGFYLTMGVGGELDYDEGIAWIRKAAEAGDENAKQSLQRQSTPQSLCMAATAAAAFNKKHGLTDFTKGQDLLKRAAEAGSAEANNILGVMYADPETTKEMFGKIGEKDYSKARVYFTKALELKKDLSAAENNLKKLAEEEEAAKSGKPAASGLKWAVSIPRKPASENKNPSV